ncbi:MAG: hypothetical protein HYV04_09210 [Deltaproteobacteria bacterium]|nr:hypothetical protein [Deltaproteobacteria bacterium]
MSVGLRSRHVGLLLAAIALLALGGCAAKALPEARYLPAGDLLDIVKDFQRLARDDLYRFPIPKDPTGVNVMKATLIRLQDYEKKHAGQYADIVHFTKAMAYERLREYDQAIAHYRAAAKSDARLGAEAGRNIEALEAFQHILQKPLSGEDPFAYIKGLDEKVDAWNAIIHKYQRTAYEYFARVEEEKIDRAKVAFMELNRYRMKDGNQLVILGYSQLITKHRESKNLHRYLLDFGDFYARLVREYVLQNDPEGLTFDIETFGQFAKSALKLYTEVAQVDGIMEKIEAEGKIEAMRGLTEKMRRLNR